MPEPTISFHTPDCCANCGGQPGSYSWVLTNRQSSYYFGFRKTTSYTFNAPLCKSCHDQLSDIRSGNNRFQKWACLVGAIIGAIGLYLFLILAEGSDAPATGILLSPVCGGVFGFFALGAFLDSLLSDKREFIGSYDGKYFNFKNPVYHRRFAALNPNLVKRW